MIEIVLMLPIIAVAAIIAYRDYKTHIVGKPWIVLLGVCGAPLACLNWLTIVDLPDPLPALLPAALFIGIIVVCTCVTLDGIQLLGLGGADALILIVLTIIFPQQILWIALIALILGVVFSSAYLYGKNKHYEAELTQKITMLGTPSTYHGKQIISWEPWTMPLCVPIAGALLITIYFWML